MTDPGAVGTGVGWSYLWAPPQRGQTPGSDAEAELAQDLAGPARLLRKVIEYGRPAGGTQLG